MRLAALEIGEWARGGGEVGGEAGGAGGHLEGLDGDGDDDRLRLVRLVYVRGMSCADVRGSYIGSWCL